MKIYFHDKMAFVETSPSYFLCIGTVEQVNEANPHELATMIAYADALARWAAIADSQGHRVH